MEGGEVISTLFSNAKKKNQLTVVIASTPTTILVIIVTVTPTIPRPLIIVPVVFTSRPSHVNTRGGCVGALSDGIVHT